MPEHIIINDLTRAQIITGIREIYKMAVQWEQIEDPSFKRWPDLEDAIDYIEEFGLPPSE